MLQKILELLAQNEKELKDSIFYILKEAAKNDTKKIEEMKKIVRILYIIAVLLFLILILLSSF